ncbi:MAG TPA: ATP-dependent helicase HrpB [Selenomonadales bacterium]|nr:ATP-dependent helicase HrpB [Selenomonadales bacterium]
MAEQFILSILPQLRRTLGDQPNAVLVAPPGAGKTTRAPLALLKEPWLADRRILLLEPRRLAARAAARHMAALLGEEVGQTVGYRVKLDTRVGPATRIEVITEGILTRMLQSDPSLEGVGLVIFDEFHERSIHSDLGLALCLEAQSVLREDLRLLVMSATLDAQAVAGLLGAAPVLASEGRAFPVETRYLERSLEGPVEPAVVRTVLEALKIEQGDVLVFLPGAAEIRRVESRLREALPDRTVRIAPLYGNLPPAAQDAALVPAPPGRRKVVLATSIAETSLTVEGVRVVVDSGLMRVPRFSPRTGMTRLETVAVSKAAAEQRRGRAGRLAPGVCYRLWTRWEDERLEARSLPEILSADLAPLALELAAWGATDPVRLLWLDPPPAAAFAQARELLQGLGALDGSGTITPHGRRMAEAGLHPRLSHMILRAAGLGLGGLACELAVLLSERDIFRGGPGGADLRRRLEAARDLRRSGPGPDEALGRRLRGELDYLLRQFQIRRGPDGDADKAGLLLALAFPDRLAQRRGDRRFLLRNGRGAAFPTEAEPLAGEAYIVAAELDDKGADSSIYLAAPVQLDELRNYFQDQITEEAAVAWDRAAQAVRARSLERIGSLVLKEAPLRDPAPEAVRVALLEGIKAEGLSVLNWTRAATQLRERLLFLHKQQAAWPDVSDGALDAGLAEWLGPYLYGVRSRADLQRVSVAQALEALLTWEQRRDLDEYAPTHIRVPSGQRIPIDYRDPDSPVLAVRLQEMFGLAETPRIAGGRTPLTLHLLSPARRPVQVTRDLASFWRTVYFEVRKDLLGRYPKHYWPDDPLSAPATHRARPRG